jgi:hypothetical protein
LRALGGKFQTPNGCARKLKRKAQKVELLGALTWQASPCGSDADGKLPWFCLDVAFPSELTKGRLSTHGLSRIELLLSLDSGG